jgi:hypothetical protein
MHYLLKAIKCYNVYLTPTRFGPSWTIIIHLCLAKVTVSLKYQLKYFVKIAVAQWQ